MSDESKDTDTDADADASNNGSALVMPPQAMWDSIGFPSILWDPSKEDTTPALFMHPSGMSMEENPACHDEDTTTGSQLTRAMTALIMTL